MKTRNLLGDWDDSVEGLDLVKRLPTEGGWVLVFENSNETFLVGMHDPQAPHCRPKQRWLKPKEGHDKTITSDNAPAWVYAKYSVARLAPDCWIARRPDGSDSYHATREAAHDALGANSPWEEVMS